MKSIGSIDTSSNEIGLASGSEKLKLYCEDIENLTLPLQSFDAITYWQSFEHMPDPRGVLNKTYDLLKDDGILLVSVPNIESLEAGIGLDSWFGLEAPMHFFQYSPSTLTRLLERNRFHVISMKKNSVEYNFPFFSQTLFNRLGGELNFLHNFFRRYKYRQKPKAFLRLYTALLTSILLLPVFAATIALYIVNGLLDNGPVIEIIAKKKDIG